MVELQGRSATCGAIARGAALLVLAFGCGLAGGPAAAQDSGYATEAYTPKSFKMPEGDGCAGDVARWKAVQDNDYASGNIGLPVYHQIQAEIARADQACRAGHDGEARALVHASKARHGYPG